METHKKFHVNVHAIIRDPQGRKLILKRGDAWTLPGGRLEDDDSVEMGLRREVFEEIGITELTVDQIVSVSLSESKETLLLTYICTTSSSINVSLSHEHSDFAWVTSEETAQYPFEFENIRRSICTY